MDARVKPAHDDGKSDQPDRNALVSLAAHSAAARLLGRRTALTLPAFPPPPQTADTTIPQGVPCTRLANLILAPKEEAKRIAAYIPRWGIWLAAHLVESKAWAMYRDRLKRFASFIGD